MLAKWASTSNFLLGIKVISPPTAFATSSTVVAFPDPIFKISPLPVLSLNAALMTASAKSFTYIKSLLPVLKLD